ncbi:MAG: cysteine desulfurase [Bryobacteraceae bacterium]|nr:cysteine desulfurase [Bryobacteraceae bacterium]
MRYFDHNATTPVAPEALAAFSRACTDFYGNPSSIHTSGQQARHAVEEARASVAAMLGCAPREVVFTSGGTEADNLAILGAPAGHVITTAIEHPAVLAAAGLRNATVVRVDGSGRVDPDEIRRALRPDTKLISVMHANNETGVLQPVAEIAAIAREAGALMHSDGVQAAGRIPVDVRALGVDLYSISGHKFNAPKGVGALYVREGVKLAARQVGGRHERERRAGTENVPGIVAMAAAAALPRPVTQPLRDRFEQLVLERIPDVVIHGRNAPRVPNTSCLGFHGIEAEALVIALDLAGFAVSTGAACSSGATRPSHVLEAMGVPPALARATIRVSMGRGTTPEDVESLVQALETAVARLRKLSPAYA